MKIVTICLAILVAAVHSHLVDYRLALTPEEPKECTAAGPFCENCTSLVECMRDGSNFTKISLGSCTAPSKCINGACTTDADPFCDGTADLPFVCTQVGLFPDPFYCNKFVLCVAESSADTPDSIKAYVNECDAGYGFDVATGLCSVKLTKKTCTPGIYPVPLCNKLGQTGALPKKTADYFICEQRNVTVGETTQNVLYPVQKQCSHGQSYANYGCGK